MSVAPIDRFNANERSNPSNPKTNRVSVRSADSKLNSSHHVARKISMFPTQTCYHSREWYAKRDYYLVSMRDAEDITVWHSHIQISIDIAVQDGKEADQLIRLATRYEKMETLKRIEKLETVNRTRLNHSRLSAWRHRFEIARSLPKFGQLSLFCFFQVLTI